MPVETHVDEARRRVREEQERTAEERRAYGRFRDELESVSTTAPGKGAGQGTAGGTLAVSSAIDRADSTAGQCRRVREAFAATVGSAGDTDADGQVLAAVREELGGTIALALAPGTDQGFTPRIKRAIHAKANEREQALAVTERALDRETDSLGDAATTVGTITDWLVEADETPLSKLGFEALRDRHATLAEHRTRCEELVRDRQTLLHSTTTREAQVGITHRSLARYLYEELPVTYPVLSTATRLDDLLADCQRAVRDHLIRKV